jgi:hypothetical protein
MQTQATVLASVVQGERARGNVHDNSLANVATRARQLPTTKAVERIQISPPLTATNVKREARAMSYPSDCLRVKCRSCNRRSCNRINRVHHGRLATAICGYCGKHLSHLSFFLPYLGLLAAIGVVYLLEAHPMHPAVASDTNHTTEGAKVASQAYAGDDLEDQNQIMDEDDDKDGAYSQKERGPSALDMGLEAFHAIHAVHELSHRRAKSSVFDGSWPDSSVRSDDVLIGHCMCYYAQGTTPPTSCSDPRCGPVTYGPPRAGRSTDAWRSGFPAY